MTESSRRQFLKDAAAAAFAAAVNPLQAAADYYDSPKFLPEFNLVDQNGQPFTKENLKGRYSVVCFFFTDCKALCPYMMPEFKKLHDALKGKAQMIAISVDPATDTPGALKKYAAHWEFPENQDSWKFLTHPSGDMRDITALHEVIVSQAPKRIEADIMHSPYFFLVDKSARVAAYYPFARWNGLVATLNRPERGR